MDSLVLGQHFESGHAVDQRVERVASYERPCEADERFHDLDPQLPHVAVEEYAADNLCHPIVACNLLPCQTACTDRRQKATETVRRECIAVINPSPPPGKVCELDPQRLSAEQRPNDAKTHS